MARPQVAPRAQASPPAQAGATPYPNARLVVITQDGSAGRDYHLANGHADIGSREGSIQLPNDPYVCPRHARVYWKNASFVVLDLGSVNGTYVRVRDQVPLHHGDLVLIGLEVLRFEVVGNAEAGLGAAVERGTHLFGSPAALRHARLCERTVEGVTRDVFHISKDETIIGRESGDVVFTADPFMSRSHASILRNPSTGEFALKDLGSSNGTYVRIDREIPLEDGDHVRIGQHLFRLELEHKRR